MKEIKILGKNFFYEVFYDCSEWGEFYETIFYKDVKFKKRKKFIFFGPLIDVPDHEISFVVHFNIEDETITKDELREVLERKVTLLERRNEILRGELI